MKNLVSFLKKHQLLQEPLLKKQLLLAELVKQLEKLVNWLVVKDFLSHLHFRVNLQIAVHVIQVKQKYTLLREIAPVEAQNKVVIVNSRPYFHFVVKF